MTAAGLTAAVDGTGRYSLTGTATVQITQGVSGNPSFHAGLSLSSDGIVAGVGLPDLSGLGFSGAGTLYAASSAMKGFDPATLGLSGQPVDLPAGLDVSLGYTLPDSVTTDLQDVIPAGSAVQAMASLPTTGFTVDLSLALGTGTGTGGLRVINSGGTSLYLDSVGLAVTLSAGGGVQVAVSGVGYLELPALVPGTTDPSAATVTVSGSLQVTADSISLGLSAGFSNWYHNEVLGIPGLGAQDFGGHVGLTYEDGATAPVPSLGIDADNITLPASWASAIGMAPGAEISFNVNLDLNNPVLAFSIAGPTVNGQQQPALTPLAVDPNLSSDVVNSFTISRAAFDLSPFGGTDPGTGDAIPAGASAIFD
ncbi:MAG: hypothetical protein JO242_17135, partial [Streptosporangiaceae bacterium]|nr:hypothetical protein [Streptosporangiaceae bacterium]